MKKYLLLFTAGLLYLILSATNALATTISIDIQAYIDGRDQLIINDDTLQ